MMNYNYHIPVLLTESIDALNISEKGIYLDLTFGGGGHSEKMLEKLKGTGKVLAFDQDQDASTESKQFEIHSNFQFIHSNFSFLKRFWKAFYPKQFADGILADLGVSSYQIDTASRGFAIRFEGELDMRMDKNRVLTAKNIVNDYSKEDLLRIFSNYGEISNAYALTLAILRERTFKEIITTSQLKVVASTTAPRGKENQYLAKVFQALRIEVNDELKVLQDMLIQCSEILKPNGALVVISYHSLEDRLVKNFFLKGKFEGEVEKDIYGNYQTPFTSVNKKPIIASPEEVEKNPRARSAKMRIGIKN